MLSLPGFTQDQAYAFDYLRMGKTDNQGIVQTDDFVVSPGAGLQVQIAAGEAYVQQTVAKLGSFYASRGQYYIFSDSVASPYNTISAPITYSRVDQIIARVYDSYEQGLGGSSFWHFEWLTGSETYGASLANLNGIASLPDNSLLIAYVLNTVGESSISGGNIQDRRTRVTGKSTAWYPSSIWGTTTNHTAIAGQWVRCGGGSPLTVTLPSPSIAGDSVKVTAAMSGGAVVTVAGSSNIYGYGAVGVSSYPIGSDGTVTFSFDGSNWFADGPQKYPSSIWGTTTNHTAIAGQWVRCGGAAPLTVTLPSPSIAGDSVKVTAAMIGGGDVMVAGSSNIWGYGAADVSSYPIGSNGTVTFSFDGSYWFADGPQA